MAVVQQHGGASSRRVGRAPGAGRAPRWCPGSLNRCLSNMLNMHEEGFVDSFVVSIRRERFRTLLATRRRRVLLRHLAHPHNLEWRFATRLPQRISKPGEIYALLQWQNAPHLCHVISESAEIDGSEMPLDHALSRIVGYRMGTFLSCIPGRLGYLESEEHGERFIFSR